MMLFGRRILVLVAVACVVAGAKKEKDGKKKKDDFMGLKTVTALTDDNYKDETNGKIGMVIHFSDGDSPEELSTLAEELEGLARVFHIDTAKETNLLEYLELTKDDAPAYRAKVIGEEEEFKDFDSVEDAKAAIIENLPEDAVAVITYEGIQQFLSKSLSQGKFGIILLTENSDIPKLLVKLSLFTQDKFSFAIMPNPPQEFMAQLQIKKVPFLFLMVPQPVPEDQGGGKGAVQFAPVPYQRKQFGGLKFKNVIRFVATVQMELKQQGIYTKLQEHGIPIGDMGGSPDAEDDGQQTNQKQKGGSGSNKIHKTKDLFELTAETTDACSSSKLGLCVIALLDGSPPNKETLEQQLEILRSVQKSPSNKGRPMHFMYVDLSCHPSFGEYFGLGLDNVPSVLAVSARKAAYAHYVGAFDGKKINAFISGVLGGKNRISALPNKDTEIPQISADDDCAAIHASMDITAEDGEDALDDDIMAEMRAEEEERQKAAEAAAEKAEEEQDDAEAELKRKRAEEEMKRLNKVSNKATNKKKKKKNKNKKKKGKKKDEL